MHGPLIAPANHPAKLLDDYAARSRDRVAGTLADTALRTRSLAARHVLARCATQASLDDLLAVARNRSAIDLPPLEPDPRALTELARVIALQNVLPSDQADGLALFDLALERFGPERIPPAHQGIHAQLALHLGDPARAALLCDTYRGISLRVRSALRLDLLNPFLDPGTGESDWLHALQELFPAPGLLLAPAPGSLPFDRVATTVAQKVCADQKISVIVTAFKPDVRLLTAVRSLIRQSWTNLEILVVDDASPPEYEPVLSACLDLDDRVRLIRLDTNGGTYIARNIGLDAASGSIVTFHDSDDWAHPLRLEHQIRPMREDPTLVATTTDGLRVTDNLVVTRPGRVLRSLNTSSLMFWKDPVLSRIGYLDSVRKAADTEYQLRIGATFGEAAVHHIGGRCYALIRLSPDSLSQSEFAAGWMHPARAAYRYAYGLWHEQIKEGTTSPYLPRQPRQRVVPAPTHLTSPGEPTVRPDYDVVFASDWRPYGGPQKSMLEEITALTRSGMRVGVMQLEAFRFMTSQRKPLCRPIQELINAGVVDHVLPTDHVEASLVIVRYPPVLQFPPSAPTNVRARRLLILANQGPSELDGSDWRYVPQTCTDVARQLFSAEPLWCPQGPAIRDFLMSHLEPAAVTHFDMPGIIDLAAWRVHRNGFRSSMPVAGRHSRDNWVKWPADQETLLLIYPDTPDIDVRVMGGARTPRTLLGTEHLPPNWLVYGYDQVSVRSFLYQIDFYVYFPHPKWVEAFGRAILEALATGCVVILPKEFSHTFGDAAVYCAPHEVRHLIASYYADVDRFLDQSRRATERVRQLFCHEAYVRLVRSLIRQPAHGHPVATLASGGDGEDDRQTEAGSAPRYAIDT